MVDRRERDSRVAALLRPAQNGERPPLKVLYLPKESIAVRHLLDYLRLQDGSGEVCSRVTLQGVGANTAAPRYAAFRFPGHDRTVDLRPVRAGADGADARHLGVSSRPG